MGKPTSYRPNKRELQKALPTKGAGRPPTGTIPGAPTKTANWPDPGETGNSAKRLRGVTKVKTRMMERI